MAKYVIKRKGLFLTDKKSLTFGNDKTRAVKFGSKKKAQEKIDKFAEDKAAPSLSKFLTAEVYE